MHRSITGIFCVKVISFDVSLVFECDVTYPLYPLRLALTCGRPGGRPAAGDNEVEFFEFADAFGRKVSEDWAPG